MAHNNPPNYALHSYGRYRFWKPLSPNGKLMDRPARQLHARDD